MLWYNTSPADCAWLNAPAVVSTEKIFVASFLPSWAYYSNALLLSGGITSVGWLPLIVWVGNFNFSMYQYIVCYTNLKP
jgi:hypothetical protein